MSQQQTAPIMPQTEAPLATNLAEATRQAPLRPEDRGHIQLSYITHFYCNQDNIDSVESLLRRYEDYSPEVLDRLQFIIVDDGSPVEYAVPKFNLNLTWLKITEDIPWNNPGARNLGVTYAKSDKLLLTDLDHEFPEATLAHMIARKNPDRDFFKIYRTDKNGERMKGHPNSFFMSRGRFMRFFGYDEEFCGGHGADDYRFVKLQKYHGSRQRYLPKQYRSFKRRDIDYRKSYHTLDRSLARNTPIDKRKELEVAAYGPESAMSRMFLNFDWKILSQQARAARPQPRPRPLWKTFWLLRWIFPYR